MKICLELLQSLFPKIPFGGCFHRLLYAEELSTPDDCHRLQELPKDGLC